MVRLLDLAYLTYLILIKQTLTYACPFLRLLNNFLLDDAELIRKASDPLEEVYDALKEKKPTEAWSSANKLCVFLWIFREELSCEL